MGIAYFEHLKGQREYLRDLEKDLIGFTIDEFVTFYEEDQEADLIEVNGKMVPVGYLKPALLSFTDMTDYSMKYLDFIYKQGKDERWDHGIDGDLKYYKTKFIEKRINKNGFKLPFKTAEQFYKKYSQSFKFQDYSIEFFGKSFKFKEFKLEGELKKTCHYYRDKKHYFKEKPLTNYLKFKIDVPTLESDDKLPSGEWLSSPNTQYIKIQKKP